MKDLSRTIIIGIVCLFFVTTANAHFRSDSLLRHAVYLEVGG